MALSYEITTNHALEGWSPDKEPWLRSVILVLVAYVIGLPWVLVVEVEGLSESHLLPLFFSQPLGHSFLGRAGINHTEEVPEGDVSRPLLRLHLYHVLYSDVDATLAPDLVYRRNKVTLLLLVEG